MCACSSCGQKYRGPRSLYRQSVNAKKYKIVNGRRVAVEATPAPSSTNVSSSEETPKPEEVKPENG